MYLRNERIRKLPLVIDAVMVSDVEDTRRPQQLYMVYSQTLYPGLGFKKGYVYGGEHGIEKVFVKKIAGLDHVYAGRRDLVTVNGSVEGIVYNGDDVAVSVLLPNGYHSLVLITCSTGYVHRFEEIVKGFTSKKRYTITRIDLGLSGSTIIALLKTIDRETNAPGPSYLFLKKTGSNYNMRALSPRSVVAGSNGLYTGVFEVVERKDKRQINLHLVFNGRYKRYRLKNDIVKPEFIRQDSLVYASNDTLIASDGASIYTIDLKKNRVLWSKEIGVVRCASVSPI